MLDLRCPIVELLVVTLTTSADSLQMFSRDSVSGHHVDVMGRESSRRLLVSTPIHQGKLAKIIKLELVDVSRVERRLSS